MVALNTNSVYYSKNFTAVENNFILCQFINENFDPTIVQLARPADYTVIFTIQLYIDLYPIGMVGALVNRSVVV